MFKLFKVTPAQMQKSYEEAKKRVAAKSDSNRGGPTLKKETRGLMNALHAATYDKDNVTVAQYLQSIKKLSGDYTNRDKPVQNAVDMGVDNAATLIKRYAKEPFELAVPNIMVKLYEILMDRKNISFFKKIFNDYNKEGENSAAAPFAACFFAMVFAMETSAYYFNLWYPTAVSPLNTKGPVQAIQDMTDEHFVYVQMVINNVIPIIAYFEVGDPNKEYSETLAQITKLNKVSNEDLIVPTAFFVAGLVVLGLFTAIAGARLLVYYMRVWRVDIGKLLVEESDILSINVMKIQDQIDKAKDPAEKERLQKVMDAQLAEIEKMRETARKLLRVEAVAASEVADQVNREDDTNEGKSNPDIVI